MDGREDGDSGCDVGEGSGSGRGGGEAEVERIVRGEVVGGEMAEREPRVGSKDFDTMERSMMVAVEGADGGRGRD